MANGRKAAVAVSEPAMANHTLGHERTLNGAAKFISSATVGVVWTTVSPVLGFGLAAALMLAGTVALQRLDKD